MKRTISKSFIQIFVAVVFGLIISIPAKGYYKSAPQHPIDIVFCLDLSGSTNGLLVDLRNQLWDIVNECGTLNPQPNLRIAVVGFSRPSFGKNNFYVKTLAELSNDFDYTANAIYNLNASIENGEHYVGAAVSHSVNKLDWSDNPDALKLIFLVGNGDVRNGSVNYATETELALKKKNIIVNTIFCHPSHSDMEMSGWKKIAKIGGGKSFEINIGNELPPLYLSKNSDNLTRLAKNLNNTYVYFGTEGKNKYAEMENADKQSRWESQFIFESRMFYKASPYYTNSNQNWDLVDYIKVYGKMGLQNIEREFLPEEYQTFNNDDLYDILIKKKNIRNRVVCEIRNSLSIERQMIINKKLEEKGWQEKTDILQLIVKNVISEYGIAKGFEAIN